MNYWEIIADNLSASGWSWGCLSHLDSIGRVLFTAEAHRDNRKRFIVRADEKPGFPTSSEYLNFAAVMPSNPKARVFSERITAPATSSLRDMRELKL
jgi:hypothetical protein